MGELMIFKIPLCPPFAKGDVGCLFLLSWSFKSLKNRQNLQHMYSQNEALKRVDDR
jgi:hypothetical protein